MKTGYQIILCCNSIPEKSPNKNINFQENCFILNDVLIVVTMIMVLRRQELIEVLNNIVFVS